ncbi:adhesion G protein-coupled receptor L4-like [Anneissia japonica]|uniref:adhesion G protein-coupled receptor L4-like n=1 Tax=Anneissia japonica TaxID=1529436 RepID=UPI001425841B|nr:adhesion G protein-coupled receptor L4-like [Anneissia japonica]
MKPKQINENKNVSQLTNVGVAISIFFLAVTLVIIYSFKDLRNSDRYKMLSHLVIALLCVNCFFLCLEGDVKNLSEIACSVLAGCLHYSLLAAFSWMLIISTDVYLKIKHPFADHDKRFSYSRYIGWIGPLIVVGVTAGITNVNYTSAECWLNSESGAKWTFIVPVCLTSLIVLVQLAVIGYVAFMKSKLPNQTEDEMQALKRMRNVFQGLLLLAPAVGISWIFGVIIIFCDWKIMEYIYVILNSMQGFFVWLSQCVFSNEVRQAFKKKFASRITQESNTNTVRSVTHNTGRIVVEDM